MADIAAQIDCTGVCVCFLDHYLDGVPPKAAFCLSHSLALQLVWPQRYQSER